MKAGGDVICGFTQSQTGCSLTRTGMAKREEWKLTCCCCHDDETGQVVLDELSHAVVCRPATERETLVC
jgi:hypothetical protein